MSTRWGKYDGARPDVLRRKRIQKKSLSVARQKKKKRVMKKERKRKLQSMKTMSERKRKKATTKSQKREGEKRRDTVLVESVYFFLSFCRFCLSIHYDQKRSGAKSFETISIFYFTVDVRSSLVDFSFLTLLNLVFDRTHSKDEFKASSMKILSILMLIVASKTFSFSTLRFTISR